MLDLTKILIHLFKKLTRSFRETRFRKKFLTENSKTEKYPSKLSTISQTDISRSGKSFLAVRIPFVTNNLVSAYMPDSLNTVEFQTLANSEKCRYFEIINSKPIRVLMINWTLKDNLEGPVADQLAALFSKYANLNIQTLHIDGTFIRCTFSAEATKLSGISVDKLKQDLRDLSVQLSLIYRDTKLYTDSKISINSKRALIYILTVIFLSTLLVVYSVHVKLVFSPNREIWLIVTGLISAICGMLVYKNGLKSYLWPAAAKFAVLISVFCMMITFCLLGCLDFCLARMQPVQELKVDSVNLVLIKNQGKYKVYLTDSNEQISDAIFVAQNRNLEINIAACDKIRIVTKRGMLADQYLISLCKVVSASVCKEIKI